MQLGTKGLVFATLLTACSLTASAAPVYLRSTVGAPWGVSTNEAAMDAVFGAGNWTDERYETVNTATLFSAGTSFIFMEGGDSNANELEGFLGSNSASIAAWVSGGGRLLLNAAPNEGDGMDFGFGVTLAPIYNFEEDLVVPAGPHPIFSGPAQPVGAGWSGGAFAHTNVFGAGLAPILVDGIGDIFLGEKFVGAGLALFGGMTTTNFHSPASEAFNLRFNIIDYTANSGLVPVVPEPGILVLLGLGLAGLGLRRRSRP